MLVAELPVKAGQMLVAEMPVKAGQMLVAETPVKPEPPKCFVRSFFPSKVSEVNRKTEMVNNIAIVD